eukprot:15473600-Alexandrium_andersonii.AAC.1
MPGAGVTCAGPNDMNCAQYNSCYLRCLVPRIADRYDFERRSRIAGTATLGRKALSTFESQIARFNIA